MKGLLEDWFDHTLLVASDDPKKEELLKLRELGLAKITEVEKTGCEGISDFLYDYINDIFLKDYGWGDGSTYENCWLESTDIQYQWAGVWQNNSGRTA